jgi:methionine synthase reductase
MRTELAIPRSAMPDAEELSQALNKIRVDESRTSSDEPVVDFATSVLERYPTYVLDIDTTVLDQGLTKLTNLAKSPTYLCKLEPMGLHHGALRQVPPIFFHPPAPIMHARLKRVKELTKPEAVKRTLHMELDVIKNPDPMSPVIDEDLEMLPGDSFAILCENHHELVQAVLDLLGCAQTADQPVRLVPLVDADALPTHLSLAAQLEHTTARELLTHAVDLKGPLRKVLIRLLADVAQDLNEKKRLLFLASKQGRSIYDASGTY